MNVIDKLRMDRRKLEVEINRIEERLNEMKEKKRDIERRIVQAQQTDGKEEAPAFKTSLFG